MHPTTAEDGPILETRSSDSEGIEWTRTYVATTVRGTAACNPSRLFQLLENRFRNAGLQGCSNMTVGSSDDAGFYVAGQYQIRNTTIGFREYILYGSTV